MTLEATKTKLLDSSRVPSDIQEAKRMAAEALALHVALFVVLSNISNVVIVTTCISVADFP